MSDVMPAPSWIPDMPAIPKRIGDVLDYGARITISLVAMWAFVEKIGKPYSTWRRKRLAEELRAILRPELDRLQSIGTCVDEIRIVQTRQTELFKDIDDFIIIARTNTERIDETNDLLDEVFHLDRRVNTERRVHIDDMLNALARRQQERRRGADEERTNDEPKKLT